MHFAADDQVELILKRFEEPDEIRHMVKGKFELVTIGGMTVGRATYEPGWKWSEHVGKALGKIHCDVEHVGLVISGTATVAFEDEPVETLKPGTIFYVPKKPHDSCYVSIHLLGADHYAK